jgi:class 3 adenylate cyclase
VERSGSLIGEDAAAGAQYLLLADITGYSSFMRSVEDMHGVDFSEGIPAAYSVLGALLNTVIEGLEPDFTVVKLEGDAVFAAAPATGYDDRGDALLAKLMTMYQAFLGSRTRAIPANDHVCQACPSVVNLDLKIVLHRGHAVRQTVGPGWDLVGPAVTLAHRMLKNNVREQVGSQPYLFLTDDAASALGSDTGLAHTEEYPDAGLIRGRILDLSQPGTEIEEA